MVTNIELLEIFWCWTLIYAVVYESEIWSHLHTTQIRVECSTKKKTKTIYIIQYHLSNMTATNII